MFEFLSKVPFYYHALSLINIGRICHIYSMLSYRNFSVFSNFDYPRVTLIHIYRCKIAEKETENHYSC